jgi:hypothetical protein
MHFLTAIMSPDSRLHLDNIFYRVNGKIIVFQSIIEKASVACLEVIEIALNQLARLLSLIQRASLLSFDIKHVSAMSLSIEGQPIFILFIEAEIKNRTDLFLTTL